MKGSALGVVVALALFLSLAGAACTTKQATERAEGALKGELPAYVTSAYSEVQGAYRYALENPEMIRYIPCYCGCETVGHISNLDCFINEIKDDRSVVWDQHGANCHTCVNIALDVQRLSREGRSLADIRSLIDESYSVLGPGTNTPFPPS